MGVAVDRSAGSTPVDKHFRPLPKPGPSKRTPSPAWAERRPNSIWIDNTTHFNRAKMKGLISMIWRPASGSPTSCSGEETSTQVQVVGFAEALKLAGLLGAIDERQRA